MKYVLSLLILICSYSFGFSQQKIGYANVEAIISQMPEYKTSMTEMETFQRKLEERYRIKNEYAQSKLQEYYDIEKNLTMDQKKSKEEELMKLEEELKQFEKEAQTEIAGKQELLMAPLQEKMSKAIEEVAKENGYNFVLNKGAGISNVLYGQKDLDVTELIAKKLGVTLAPAPVPGTTPTPPGK
jgi:outer membrane protein